jgi:hypothetical protein
VKVKVSAPVQIVHAGTTYTQGDVIDSPDGDANNVAQEWIAAGWATEVKGGSAVPSKAAPRKRSG